MQENENGGFMEFMLGLMIHARKDRNNKKSNEVYKSMKDQFYFMEKYSGHHSKDGVKKVDKLIDAVEKTF